MNSKFYFWVQNFKYVWLKFLENCGNFQFFEVYFNSIWHENGNAPNVFETKRTIYHFLKLIN